MRFRQIKTTIVDFLQSDIWRIRLKSLPVQQAIPVKALRIVLLTARRFQENNCPLRASALTFYSLLSIVPVVAMAFGIAKGFGFEKILEKELLEQLQSQREVMLQVIAFATSLIENTKGGIIAGIGLGILFWSVIKVLSHIEVSLNEIWEIKKARSFGRKFNDYLSMMLIAPVLIILSNSVTVFITTQVTQITEKVKFISTFGPLIYSLLKLLPYGLIWILFTTIYILMPNTRVKYSAGISAGLLAGSCYQLLQLTYIKFQVGTVQYNAIYGSFAALPLFLIWLQLSWLIILMGAEFSFAFQNVEMYEYEPDTQTISPALERRILLSVCHRVVKNFSEGTPPLSAKQISCELDIPIRLLNRILDQLVSSGLFSCVKNTKLPKPVYQPARDINSLTIQSVIEVLENRGIGNVPFLQTAETEQLTQALQTFRDAVKASPANRLLKDL